MSRKLVIWLAILGLILLSILCICNHRDKIETDLLSRSSAAIEGVEGFEGDLGISGRDITINGITDTDNIKATLLQLLKNEFGIRKVFDNLAVKAPEVLRREKIEEVQEVLNQIIEFDNIEFQSSTAIILPESSEILGKTAEVLKDNTDMNIEIGGHTDSTGNEEYNIELSQRRANSVLIKLVEREVDRERLTAVGYGSSQSIADNSTDEGKQKNRRVEFKIKEDM